MTTVRAEDRSDGVRLLTLDRPPANAITAGLLADLWAALDAARDDPGVRAVVLTGEGRFFSAGLDLRGGIDFQAATSPGPAVDPFGALRTCLLNFLRFPKPTVAMLRGHAIAGGLILVLACDYRLGVNGEYRIGLNEVEIGASFPKAAFEIVRLRLTHQQASELLLGAAHIPGGPGRPPRRRRRINRRRTSSRPLSFAAPPASAPFPATPTPTPRPHSSPTRSSASNPRPPTKRSAQPPSGCPLRASRRAPPSSRSSQRARELFLTLARKRSLFRALMTTAN